MKVFSQINDALTALDQGQVIAYPTEAVYGLGCNPFNEQAVHKLLDIKKRDMSKGLILLIQDWSQLNPLIQSIKPMHRQKLEQCWPGPVTFLIAKSQLIPAWISGAHASVAIRMTDHPIAKQLCREGAIVSTSANVSNHPPATNLKSLQHQFKDRLAGVVEGPLGGQVNPSKIIELNNNKIIRP